MRKEGLRSLLSLVLAYLRDTFRPLPLVLELTVVSQVRAHFILYSSSTLIGRHRMKILQMYICTGPFHNLKSNITVRQNKLKDESSVEYRGVAAPYKSGKHKYVYLLFNQKQHVLNNETIHSWKSTFEDQNVANLLESV